MVFSFVQTRLHSWRQTCEDPWRLEWWGALAPPVLQESQGLLVLSGIQVAVGHRDTEAYQENLETQVPEV